MRNTRLFVLFLAVGLLLSGCVAQSKYRDLEAKASAERSSLESDILALKSQVDGQRQEVARREAQIASLTKQMTDLEKQTADLQARKAALERQVAEITDRLREAGKHDARKTNDE